MEELPRSTGPPHNCTMTLRLEVSPGAILLASLPASPAPGPACLPAWPILPRERWDGTRTRTRLLVCKSNVSCRPLKLQPQINQIYV